MAAVQRYPFPVTNSDPHSMTLCVPDKHAQLIEPKIAAQLILIRAGDGALSDFVRAN